MSTLPQHRNNFSFALGSSSALPLLDSKRWFLLPITQLPPPDLQGVLILDLGLGDSVDADKLALLAHYAELRRDGLADEETSALGIVGDLSAFQNQPELIVWLQADGVWPQWSTHTEAQVALNALWAKVRRERRTGRVMLKQQDEEKERHAQERVLRLLDALGYAYFMCELDGSTLISSLQEKRLLEIRRQEAHVLDSVKGEAWWVYPEQRRRWLNALEEKSTLTQHPALLRTHENRHRWVNIDCRLTLGPEGQPVLEGIYQDATQPKFTERLSKALARVGSAGGGVQETMEIVCQTAAYLFEVEGAALLCQAEWEGHEERLFPMHIWHSGELATVSARGSDLPAPLSRSSTLLLVKLSDIPWIQEIDGTGPAEIHAAHIRPPLRILFPALVDMPHRVFVLPLPQRPVAEHEGPGDALKAYLWLPVTHKLTFEPEELWPSIQSFLYLCTRQLLLAANRDAFSLMHHVLAPFVPPAPPSLPAALLPGFAELCSALDQARLALGRQMSIEACSIFHAGIEDRKRTLSLSATSGLIQAVPKSTPSYELGDGLMGTIALKQKPYLSFGIQDEPVAKHKHVERTVHLRQTWLGVPLLSRDSTPRTVGMIRCVNRNLTIGTMQHVTGFSALDVHVLVEFGRACALLIELAQVQEVQRRTLSRVSHELRSPAVGMRNNILYIKEHFGSQESYMIDKLRTKFDDLELDVHVLINLLAQVDLLRGKGRTVPREQAVDLSVRDVILKTLNQLTPELKARELPRNSILTQFSEPPLFRLPRAAFTQVIFNLFMNAIKYSTPKDFRVVIYGRWASKEFGRYEIGLKDWGIGVDEKYKERIFEGEFRTPHALRHDPTGLGLGLAISRKIMRELGGDLVLASCKHPTELVLHIPAELAVS